MFQISDVIVNAKVKDRFSLLLKSFCVRIFIRVFKVLLRNESNFFIWN